MKAIQVTTSLSDKRVEERELTGLLEAMESYELEEGLIVTENEEGKLKIKDKKIKIIPMWKWLLEEIL